MAKSQEFAVHITGLQELRSELKKLMQVPEWRRAFREAGKEAAAIVAREAKRRAPKLTGRLAGDIRPLAPATRAEVAAGRVSVPYAGVIEWGWPDRGIAEQAYLRSAAEAKAPEAAQFYLRALDRIVVGAFPEP